MTYYDKIKDHVVDKGVLMSMGDAFVGIKEADQWGWHGEWDGEITSERMDYLVELLSGQIFRTMKTNKISDYMVAFSLPNDNPPFWEVMMNHPHRPPFYWIATTMRTAV